MLQNGGAGHHKKPIYGGRIDSDHGIHRNYARRIPEKGDIRAKVLCGAIPPYGGTHPPSFPGIYALYCDPGCAAFGVAFLLFEILTSFDFLCVFWGLVRI